MGFGFWQSRLFRLRHITPGKSRFYGSDIRDMQFGYSSYQRRCACERKVRASYGRVPANYRWRQLQGQCNRNRPPARVRMERRGKSSPLFRRRERLCKPHSMQEKRTYRLPAASLNRSSRTATFGSDRCLSSTEPGLQTALVYPAESAGFLFFRYLRVGSDRIVDFFYRED